MIVIMIAMSPVQQNEIRTFDEVAVTVHKDNITFLQWSGLGRFVLVILNSAYVLLKFLFVFFCMPGCEDWPDGSYFSF